MKPISFKYSNIDKHGDDQVHTFSMPGLLVAIVCDGISTSSCGHVAAAFICYHICNHIEKEYKEGKETSFYRDMATNAIEKAGEELAEFALKIKNSYASPIPDDTSMPATNASGNEISMPNIAQESPASLPTAHNEKAACIKEDTPIVADALIWEMYKTICSEFKYPEFDNNREKIIKLLNAPEPFFFGCTLTLNLIYKLAHKDYWEILSINYGDSEFYVITWDQTNKKITAFLPHYKPPQDVLRSYISSNGNIPFGNPVILTRNVNPGDTILLCTDGANLHYTTKGGFPYEPFKRKFAKTKTVSHSLESLPKAWFDYLSSEQAVNDDFSLVIIEFLDD